MKRSIVRETVFVAAGGALGTLLRYGLNVWLHHPSVPLATGVENVTGAFLLGCVTGYLATHEGAPAWLRTGVGGGFCGGFTTMSTFAADAFLVLLRQDLLVLGLYVGLSLIGGILMARWGIKLGEAVGHSKAAEEGA